MMELSLPVNLNFPDSDRKYQLTIMIFVLCLSHYSAIAHTTNDNWVTYND
jgi:hypothetical protein